MQKKDSDLDVNNLFEETISLEGIKLDIEVPQTVKAQTTLPDDFQIKDMTAVGKLNEYVALNYMGYLNLYRGHESAAYKIESTIARLAKQFNKWTPKDVVDIEAKVYSMFCHDIFKEDWLKYKLNSSDEDLFKMSIGRHLGLPCRLIDVTAKLKTAIWFAVMNPRYYDQDGEIILIVLDKNQVICKSLSPFNSTILSFAHEPFGAIDTLNDLPLGEQRRFVQNGHFIWVDDNSLLKEQRIIEDSAVVVRHFTIPSYAKQSLAAALYQDVFSGCAYRSDMAKIYKSIYNQYNDK